MRRGVKSVLGAVLVSLAVAAPAAASTVTIDKAGVLRYTAARSEANHLVLRYNPAAFSYELEDTGVPSITVSAQHCTAVSSQLVRCTFGTFAAIDAHLGDGASYARDELEM